MVLSNNLVLRAENFQTRNNSAWITVELWVAEESTERQNHFFLSHIPTAATPLLEVDTFLSITGTMLILPFTPNDVLFFQIIPLFLSHIPHYSFCSFGLPASLSSNFLSSTLCVSSCFMSLSSFSSHYSRNYYFCVTHRHLISQYSKH